MVGAFILATAGYHLGTWESKKSNQIIENSRVVQYESEEQIFDFLYNQDKDAVFVHFYFPGHSREQRWMKAVEEASGEPKYKNIVFMSVHCRKHLSFCMGKAFPGRQQPMAELAYINESDQVELLDMDTRHRSVAGIQSLIEASGLVEPDYEAPTVLQSAGKKMVQLHMNKMD